MRALTLHDGVVQYDSQHAAPEPQPGETLVQVTQAGICETDLQLAKGYMGFSGILGHEFVGIAQSGKFQGQRVAGEINCNCGACPMCHRGLGNHCPNRTVIGIDRHHGAFAEHVAVPESNLHPIPDNVLDDEAVFVEPLAAAFQIGEQVSLAPGDRVVICGDGRLAMMTAIALSLTTEQLTVIGKHDTKLRRFSERDVTTQLLSDLDSTELLGSFDVAVDCTGSPTGLPLALNLVRPRGTVVLKTTVAGNHELSLAKIVIDEINLVGSRCGPFDQAVQAMQQRLVDLSDLITHRFPISDGELAMKTATQPEAFKVVLNM